MTRSSETNAPPTISLLALADRFVQTHTTMSNRAFAFVLGAGASRSSGIKGAAQMAADWVRSLHREAVGDTDADCAIWATARTLGIAHYDAADPAASYSELYRRMYAQDPDRGYAYLEAQMRAAEPSFGYSVLARIMDTTQHKVVVTTNFDNLVADSLSIFSKTYPLVCGHESLAGFISARARRPLVVKVHRDLLLAPKSAPEDLGDLPEGFRDALADIFRHYTPIVIGYGGNDGSLMKLLSDLPARSVPGGVYWCYWDEGPRPSDEIQRFIAAQQGTLVPIPGFDEAMMLLGDALEFDVPDKFVLDRAEARAKRIVEQAQALQARLKDKKNRMPANQAPPDAESISADRPRAAPGHAQTARDEAPAEIDALADAVEKTMQRHAGELRWWQWYQRAKAATDSDARDRIYQQGINALPFSAELFGSYALFLTDERKEHDKAEAYYLQAIAANPADAVDLGNYANFLTDVRKDHDKAEAHYRLAIAADPTQATNLGNYAVFLSDVRKDYAKAETYYTQSLASNAADATTLGNYAMFLHGVRKDYDKAEAYYTQALAADPANANNLSSYALFLADVRRDDDKAEAYFARAFAVDPNDANTMGDYACFLLSVGRTEEGVAVLDRALAALVDAAPSAMAAQVWMCAACHWIPEGWREALAQLKTLLLTHRVTTGAWDFTNVIEAAKRRGHPAARWLGPLAAVCAGTADASTLDGWDAWNPS